MVAGGAVLDREVNVEVALRVVATDAAQPGDTPRQTSVPVSKRINMSLEWILY